MNGIYHRLCTLFVVAFLGMPLGACVTREATFGDRLASEGTATSQLADQWNRGDEMVREGAELRDAGVENSSKGRDQISDGEAMIAEGERLRRAAEEAYASQTLGRPAPASN